MSTTVVVGDGEMLHLECAGEHDEADEIEINEEWDEYPGDGYCDDGTPHSCGACNGYLVEDGRVTESILARDILNLTVEARSQAATITASTLAAIASKHDTQPNIVSLVAQAIAKLAQEPSRYHAKTAHEAMRLTREWAEMFAAREVLHIEDTEEGDYHIADSRGYLAYGFEDRPCAACGCAVGSYALTDDDDYWCPACFVVQ